MSCGANTLLPFPAPAGQRRDLDTPPGIRIILTELSQRQASLIDQIVTNPELSMVDTMCLQVSSALDPALESKGLRLKFFKMVPKIATKTK